MTNTHKAGRSVRTLLGMLGAAALLLVVALEPARAQSSAQWVGTWAAALESGARVNPPGFVNQTLRFIVRTSLGGSTARIQLSNAYGTDQLFIGTAHLGLQSAGASIIPGSDRTLTFNGLENVIIPAGGNVYSDPVSLNIPQLSNVAITLYLPGPAVTPVTGHSFSMMTNYTSPAGNFASATEMPVGTTACFTIAPRPCIAPWYLISRLEVMAPQQSFAVVTLGDSITDGDTGGSTINQIDKNVRWPGYLANRLLAQQGGPAIAVLNEGLSGNHVLGSNGALDRLQRDVLSQQGVQWVVYLEGINDISGSKTYIADQLITAGQSIVAQVHALGLKIAGATVLPDTFAVGSVQENNRTALNDWIRSSGAFDAVIDFDAVIRDPARPNWMLAAYNSDAINGSNTHPSALGYQVMANAIDLGLFKGDGGPYPWSGVYADVNGDGVVDCQDLVAARAVMGTQNGQPAFAPTADIDGNGVIDIRDIAAISRALPAGTLCH